MTVPTGNRQRRHRSTANRPGALTPAWRAWTLAGALVLVAWLTGQITPADEAAEAPFVVTGEVGDHLQGRNIEATISQVRLADAVTTANGWSAQGVWFVVDLDISTVRSGVQASPMVVSLATLTTDGQQYRPSERPGYPAREWSLTYAALRPGIPLSGNLAFELDPGVELGEAVLDLSVSDDVRLDSVLRLTIDLATLERAGSLDLAETSWGEPW